MRVYFFTRFCMVEMRRLKTGNPRCIARVSDMSGLFEISASKERSTPKMRHSIASAIFLLAMVLFPMSPAGNAQSVTHTCTNASISGNYGYSISGLLSSSGGFAAFGAAGIFTSDGNGNFTGSDSATEGAITARTFTATYTVNSDCTGTAAFADSLGNTAAFNLLVGGGGEAVQFMQTDSGTIIAGEAQRRRAACTVQDVNGSYAFAIHGFYIASNTLQAVVDAGRMSANGNGTLALTDAISQSGTVTSRTIPGTYAINSNCTGLATFNDPNLGSFHANFTVVSSGRRIQFLQSDANFIVTGSAEREFAPAGILSHIASGGFWKTTITLVSLKPTANEVRVNFRADSGAPLTLPMTVTLQGASTTVTASTLDRTIPPGGTLLIETEAPASPTVVGWAQVLSSGPVEGSAIFGASSATGSSEGTAPLDTSAAYDLILPFDETAGFTTGAAFVNLSNTTAASITVTVRDDSGTELGTPTILPDLPANGHTSFAVGTQFPAAVGKRGTIELLDTSGGGIAGLGLRFNVFGSFTSTPIIVKQ